MTFTPLETMALTALLSLVVGLTVHVLTRRSYVSQDQCGERRRGMCSVVDDIRKDSADAQKKIEKSTGILFCMVRALVAYSKDLPPEVRKEILNEKGPNDA